MNLGSSLRDSLMLSANYDAEMPTEAWAPLDSFLTYCNFNEIHVINLKSVSETTRYTSPTKYGAAMTKKV
jgi:hypothetical protein